MRETGLADKNSRFPLFIDLISVNDLTKYVEQCKKRIVLPIGSIEPHLRTLPLGTDKIIAEKLAIELAEEFHKNRECLLIAPVLSYSVSIEWKESNSTITLSPITMFYLLKDILISLMDMGFKNIIILNAHGGNSEIIRLTAREFVMKYNDVNIIVIDWWKIINDLIEKYTSTGNFLHSDEVEISLLLYWKIIDNRVLAEVIKSVEKEKTLPWLKDYGIEHYTRIPHEKAIASYGDPSRASRELGELLIKEFKRRATEIILKLT